MKKILIVGLVLLLVNVPLSHGMSGDEQGYDFFWRESTEREKRRREKEEDREEPAKRRATEHQIPLPTLPTRHEQASTGSIPSYPIASLSTGAQDTEPGQSHLERLPQELFYHILQFLPSQHSGSLTLASESLRGRSQAEVTHLTIPVSDITPEKLHNAADKFPKVTSLTITKADTEPALTPEQLTLVATNFPKITSLNLSDTDLTAEVLETLAQPGRFSSLKKLDLSTNNIHNASIAALIEAPFAHTLESLNLRNTGIAAAEVATLATPGKLTALKELDLGLNDQIGDEGIAELIKAPFVHKLEFLNLYNTDITSAGVATLVTPGKLTALKGLDLGLNDQIHDWDMNKLIEAPFAHIVEELGLENIDMTLAGVVTLATPGKLTALKKLNLSHHPGLSDESIDELIKAPFVHKLESLKLADTGITSAGVATLATPGKLIALKKLSLASNDQIRDKGIAELIKAPFVHILEELGVAATGITSTGVATLATPGKLIALKGLDLGLNDQIRDKGIAELIKAPFVHILEYLDLEKTGITPDGVISLATPGKLIALKVLILADNQIGDEGIAELIQAPFVHKLEFLDLDKINISDRGIELLTLPNTFVSLKKLALSHEVIRDEGIAKLGKAPFAGKLEFLYISGADITEEAEGRLIEAQIAKKIILRSPQED